MYQYFYNCVVTRKVCLELSVSDTIESPNMLKAETLVIKIKKEVPEKIKDVHLYDPKTESIAVISISFLGYVEEDHA